MNDVPLPADPRPEGPIEHAGPPNGAPADRRSFLRGIAALAAGAAGGALLGETLLVRNVHAQLLPLVVVTESDSFTISETVSLPRTETRSGTVATQPGQPPTFTATTLRPASAVVTYTNTVLYQPPAGGAPQSVTIAGTYTISQTPPVTNTLTFSLRGSSCTMTVSNDPTAVSTTKTISYSWSYTQSDDDEDGDGNGGGMPGGDSMILALRRAQVETVDAEGLSLFDPFHRRGEPMMLQLFASRAAG